MGNKNSRRRKADTCTNGDLIAQSLGLDPDVWLVSAGYSKGILSGSRYTTVSVFHLPTGRSASTSFYASGKAAARRDAASFVKKFVREVQGK